MPGRLRIAVAFGAWMLSATITRADVLVTAQEAQLPPPKGAIGIATRGITRGPKVEYLSDDHSGTSPAKLTLRFESFGGATIDLNTVKVTYLRTPNVDVTARVRPFLQPTGLVMPNAELPPGEHLFRIDVTDSGGRTGTANFMLKIAP